MIMEASSIQIIYYLALELSNIQFFYKGQIYLRRLHRKVENLQ